MLTISSRALGVLLSGAALVGWLAGSILNPPVAVTQTAPPRPAATPVVRVALPHLAWPAVTPAIARPAPSRNPFTFRSETRLGGDARSLRGVAPDPEVAETAAPEPDTRTAAADVSIRWRLSGVAASDDGDVVAVIAGGGDVYLMRAGDVLPSGDSVVEVGLDHVVVRTAAGLVTLRLP